MDIPFYKCDDHHNTFPLLQSLQPQLVRGERGDLGRRRTGTLPLASKLLDQSWIKWQLAVEKRILSYQTARHSSPARFVRSLSQPFFFLEKAVFFEFLKLCPKAVKVIIVISSSFSCWGECQLCNSTRFILFHHDAFCLHVNFLKQWSWGELGQSVPVLPTSIWRYSKPSI